MATPSAARNEVRIALEAGGFTVVDWQTQSRTAHNIARLGELEVTKTVYGLGQTPRYVFGRVEVEIHTPKHESAGASRLIEGMYEHLPTPSQQVFVQLASYSQEAGKGDTVVWTMEFEVRYEV